MNARPVHSRVGFTRAPSFHVIRRVDDHLLASGESGEHLCREPRLQADSTSRRMAVRLMTTNVPHPSSVRNSAIGVMRDFNYRRQV